MKKIMYSVMAIFALFSLFSCTKNIDHIEPETTSDYIGFISAYNESSTEFLDKEGFLVSLEGTNITSTTTGTGKYQLKEIKKGNYLLSITKEGFATVKYPVSIISTGGNEPVYGGYKSTRQVSNTAIVKSNVKLTTTTGSYFDYDLYQYVYTVDTSINISAKITTITSGFGGIIAYIDTTDKVSNGKYVTKISPYNTSSSDSISYTLKKSDLVKYYNLKNNQKYYVKIYGCNLNSGYYYEYYGYTDYETGLFVNTDLNPVPSKVYSFKF